MGNGRAAEVFKIPGEYVVDASFYNSYQVFESYFFDWYAIRF